MITSNKQKVEMIEQLGKNLEIAEKIINKISETTSNLKESLDGDDVNLSVHVSIVVTRFKAMRKTIITVMGEALIQSADIEGKS